jgi:Flp pilus assembly protein TadD
VPACEDLETRQKNPDDPQFAADAAYFLGKAPFQMRQYNKASQAFQEAAKLRPNDGSILHSLDLGIFQAGDLDGMRRLLEDMKQKLPERGIVTVEG